MNSPLAQRGYTLLEMLIVVVMVGLLALASAPLFSMLRTSQRQAYDQQTKLYNQLIGGSLLEHASANTTSGALPPPYTGNGYTSTVYNPDDTSPEGLALSQILAQSGANVGEINDDGTAAANVRVYQQVAGLTATMPMYTRSGPLVRLTYQLGAIYMTACPKAASACGTTMGVSPTLTASNATTWKTAAPDGAASFVSTLPLQKGMLATSVARLDRVRDQLLGYLRASQITAAAGDATNWYPAGSISLSGASPGSNQGCRDGWYDLSSTQVLPLVGLSTQEYGVTAWGGRVEYCRDYDPTGTKTANATPHYAAIRVHADLSLGISPDPAVLGNNVVLSF